MYPWERVFIDFVGFPVVSMKCSLPGVPWLLTHLGHTWMFIAVLFLIVKISEDGGGGGGGVQGVNLCPRVHQEYTFRHKCLKNLS